MTESLQSERAPTATLCNETKALPASSAPTRLPPTLRRVVIVGGGSAGWMTALILASALLRHGVEIDVVESPNVGIIGVGEGSTPWLRGFFDSLGIEESEWMPACNATYKCGITFDGWSTKPGFASYFHPFASMLDNLTLTQFVHNAVAHLNGADVHAHPNRFFIASRLADQRLAPKPQDSFPFDVWYGYHFDSVLLGQYLHRKAVERGVRYLPRHVTGVNLNERGDIASVSIRDGEPIAADIFVDCTGFAGLLVQKALATPFVSFADNLFNDAAIAIPSPMGESIPCHTISTALRHGWRWIIPLTSRYGNGYVYSSAFCSAAEAERELRENLGLLDADTPARHLKMKIGRVDEALEPQLPRRWPGARLHRAARGDRPALHPAHGHGLRRIPGSRGPLRCRARALQPADQRSLRRHSRLHRHALQDEHSQGHRVLARQRGQHAPVRAAEASVCAVDVGTQYRAGRRAANHRQGLPVFSWYSIMSGMGIYPDRSDLRPPSAAEARYSMEEIDNLMQRSALNFRPHRDVLADIPPRRKERALQIYFW